jgi:hypothetical protein
MAWGHIRDPALRSQSHAAMQLKNDGSQVSDPSTFSHAPLYYSIKIYPTSLSPHQTQSRAQLPFVALLCRRPARPTCQPWC